MNTETDSHGVGDSREALGAGEAVEEAAADTPSSAERGAGRGDRPLGNRFEAAERMRLTAEQRRDVAQVEKRIRRQRRESGFLWDSRRNLIAARDGTRDRVGFKTEEFWAARGGLYTHNHPDDGSFSPDDLALASRYNLREVRAVCLEYQYVVRPKGGEWAILVKADLERQYTSPRRGN